MTCIEILNISSKILYMIFFHQWFYYFMEKYPLTINNFIINQQVKKKKKYQLVISYKFMLNYILNCILGGSIKGASKQLLYFQPSRIYNHLS